MRRASARDLLGEDLVAAGHRTQRELVADGTSTGSSPRRKRVATETSSFVESLRKRRRSCSGAVTRKACSWLAACVLASTAERWAARRTLIISTRPSALLGSPTASPAYSLPWLLPPSMGSDFPLRLRWRRLGISTSTTEIPWPQVACESGSVVLHSTFYPG